tara:strand:- start:2462 stop:3367 length:906 start_codon:yes stop_codon:yes gene_type:complete
MPYIEVETVDPGDTATALKLNASFTDFTTTDLDTENVRDAAIDLPQIKTTDFMAPYGETFTIGKIAFDHALPVIATCTTSAPGTAHVVHNGTGTPTVANLGASGLTVTDEQLLRVYWDLSINPTFGTSPFPWAQVGSIAYHLIDNGSGGSVKLPTNASCWMMWLQWDITDNTLTNFTEVPGQGDFSTNFTASVYGEDVVNTAATTIIPAWVARADQADDGDISGSIVAHRIGWRGVTGNWLYQPLTSQTTIYGLRLVIKGLGHMYNNGGTNYIALDVSSGSASETLEYTSGAITVFVNRLS